MSWLREVQSSSVAETLRIGRSIAEALNPGDVVALVGQLGAGKTHLAKGIAVGLGVSDEKLVNSPTFVLVNEYSGSIPIYHIDAYRLADASQLAAIGFEEMCGDGGMVLIEWADRVRSLIPPAALWIEILMEGEQSRRIVLQANDSALAERLAATLDRR